MMKINEGDVVKIRVGLFAQKFNKSSKIGDGGLLASGSHVWLDQIVDDKYIFTCFKPYQDRYVSIPQEYLEEQDE